MPKARMNDDARHHRPDPHWLLLASEFLLTVWDLLREHRSDAYVVVAARHPVSGKWIEQAFKVKEAEGNLRDFFRTYSRNEYDLYWCPNPFRRPRRVRANATSTPYGWCDIDRGRWIKFKPVPNVVWWSSPQRTQGLWLWNRFETAGQAEAYSRALAYHHRGDRNGWSYTKLLRIPYTFNHKPEYRRPEVEPFRFDHQAQWRRPRVLRGKVKRRKTLTAVLTAPSNGRAEKVLASYKAVLPFDRDCLMKHKHCLSDDRSRCIFMIVQALHAAGASSTDIAAVVWHSPISSVSTAAD